MFIPAQTTEREPGGYEDCVWSSGVMLQNAAHAANVSPSTRHEYEALRVAGGDGPAENPGDGSNLKQLVTGIQVRYRWTAARIGPPGDTTDWLEVLYHLGKPGAAGVLQGSMGAFPINHALRRWDRQFDGPHATYVERLDNTARLWWMNPEAPNEYRGEFVTLSDIRRYFEAFTGGLVYARVGQLVPVVHRLHIAHNAEVRHWPQKVGCLDTREATTRIWDNPESSAPAGPLQTRAVCRTTRKLVRVALALDGTFQGRLVRIGKGVTWS